MTIDTSNPPQKISFQLVVNDTPGEDTYPKEIRLKQHWEISHELNRILEDFSLLRTYLDSIYPSQYDPNAEGRFLGSRSVSPSRGIKVPGAEISRTPGSATIITGIMLQVGELQKILLNYLENDLPEDFPQLDDVKSIYTKHGLSVDKDEAPCFKGMGFYAT